MGIGMFVFAGLVLIATVAEISLIKHVIFRFKEFRMHGMLETLEWLAVNVSPRGRSRVGQEVAASWAEAQRIFEGNSDGHAAYLELVHSASTRDLYWAARFGSELRRLALRPLDEDPEHRSDDRGRRSDVVATHVHDFVVIAQRLLRGRTEPRPNPENEGGRGQEGGPQYA